MKWQNIKLIFSRELRDQLRDRRTLFTVAVMPMLLYPLMGMAMLQVGQFMRQYPTQVWLVGQQHLPSTPALITDGQLNPEYINPAEKQLLELHSSAEGDQQFKQIVEQYQKLVKLENGAHLADKLVQQELARRNVDIAVYFPAEIKTPLLSRAGPVDPSSDTIENSRMISSADSNPDTAAVPVYIFMNSAKDKSRMGAERMAGLISRWQTAYVSEIMRQNHLPSNLAQAVTINRADIADKGGKQAALWSKVLPFIIVIWALTGAFYPAIDLCAGEKERGTFETLLSSPAARSEIALGKLLTVMTFSGTTSLLNLLSMGFTGAFVIAKLGGSMGMSGLPIGFPPIGSLFWLMLALIPIAALFSAVALAAAAFARSSKEGQYYLVPLMMISMPLMIVPMLPASQLELGTSLIPISGLMLLLRGLIEGQYAECLRYVGPVVLVTFGCCWFAVKWVIHQFNSETVLFRASEQFSVSGWMKSMVRERHELPSLGSALICGLIILVCKFFIGFVVHAPHSFQEFAFQTVVILIATIGVPAVLMALVLTRNARKSLRLNLCSVPVACAAVLAAICLNPLFTWVTALVMHVYPPAGDLIAMEAAVSNIMGTAPGLWAMLLVFAVAPAIIEEIGFRGFILTGMESLKNKWQAILISSILFGIAHSVIQQSIITFLVGMVLGLIAAQARSIIPCMLFHATHNGLAVMLSNAEARVVESSPWLSQILMTENGTTYQYGLPAGILMTVLGVLLLVWFVRLPASKAGQQPRSEALLGAGLAGSV